MPAKAETGDKKMTSEEKIIKIVKVAFPEECKIILIKGLLNETSLMKLNAKHVTMRVNEADEDLIRDIAAALEVLKRAMIFDVFKGKSILPKIGLDINNIDKSAIDKIFFMIIILPLCQICARGTENLQLRQVILLHGKRANMY